MFCAAPTFRPDVDCIVSRSRSKSVCGAIAITMCCLFPTTGVVAQELATFESLIQNWTELNQKLSNAEEQLASADGDTETLRDEYTDLVDQAHDAIESLRDEALRLIKQDKDEGNKALRTLMGILLNDAQKGDDRKVLSIGQTLIEQTINPIWFEKAAQSERLSLESREIFDELLIRQREAEADDLPRVKLKTTEGDIVVELYEDQAPGTVGNFISLVESGYYSDRKFHRVIEDFMAQTGGFKSDGSGGQGPGYSIKCECYTPEARPHFTGCLSMAHVGRRDTGGAQFFITFTRTDFLDGKHTVFGRVIEGMEHVDNLQRTHVTINGREEEIPDVTADRILSAEVVRKRDHEYRPNRVGEDDEEPTADKDEKPPASPDLSRPDDES